MTPEEYAKEYLFREIKEIETSYRLNILTELTVYEKAIIFKYSEDGYEDLNEKLRLSNGNNISNYGILLGDSLSKLPNYEGIVYRGVKLNNVELNKYMSAFSKDEPIVEPFFVSTSISQLSARMFGNVRFEIFSKNGKKITEIARFNEGEVIFKYNTEFIILDISAKKDIIIMREK
jgi:hypothetical protein